MDITTWVRCFSLYMAVLSTQAPEMVPSMVAHLRTVLRLQQRASHNLAWLEYDIQFRMEIAASADRVWKCGDPWQYVACLPGQHLPNDPFEVAELDALPALKGKGKRPLIQEGERGVPRPPLKSRRRASAGSTIPRRGMPIWQGLYIFAPMHWLWGHGRAWSHILPGDYHHGGPRTRGQDHSDGRPRPTPRM